MASSCSAFDVLGRPKSTPLVFARAKPACVRSISRSRSNCATALMTLTVMRLAEVVRSTPPMPSCELSPHVRQLRNRGRHVDGIAAAPVHPHHDKHISMLRFVEPAHEAQGNAG